MIIGDFISYMRLHRRRKERTMIPQLTSILCRFLFGVAFFLFGVAVVEKVALLFKSSILGGLYNPGRLMEFSAIALIFVIALQLREIKILLRARGSD